MILYKYLVPNSELLTFEYILNYLILKMYNKIYCSLIESDSLGIYNNINNKINSSLLVLFVLFSNYK
jgi:hypothetical protein